MVIIPIPRRDALALFLRVVVGGGHVVDDVVPEAEEAGREDGVEDEEEEGEDGHGVVGVPLRVRVGGLAQAHEDGEEEELPAGVMRDAGVVVEGGRVNGWLVSFMAGRHSPAAQRRVQMLRTSAST